MISSWAKDGKIQINAVYINGDKSNDKEDFKNRGIAKLNLMEYVRTMSAHALTNKAILYVFNSGNEVGSEGR